MAEMADLKRKWSLEDLVDFEARLHESVEGGSAEERRRYREEVARLEGGPQEESARRRLGLRIWLESGRDDRDEGAGRRVVGALRGAALLLGAVAFLGGIGVMRGLLTEVFLRSYNVWIFLAAAIGVQWLLLLGGLAGYAFVRRQAGALSLFQRVGSVVVRRWTSNLDGVVWRGLLEGGAGYRSALSWRLARLTQGVAVMFNLGLMAGFYGCLFFLSVRFYWESTFEGSGWGLLNFMEGMARPWSWSGVAGAPVQGDIEYSVLLKIFYEREDVQKLWPFLMMSLLFYGLLPRVMLWWWCANNERRALGSLAFQAPRHRELWRQLTKVERCLPSKGQADGVVLLDVGGTGVTVEAVREFLLRELRVNPQARHTAGVLDEEREREALAAIEEAELGVVFLVEGWALSPKEMRVLYKRVRAVGGDELPMNFLVLGELQGGEPGAPSDEDWQQWKAFVDSLRDPAAEAVAYREPAAVEEES